MTVIRSWGRQFQSSHFTAEHVYENHMIASFIRHMDFNYQEVGQRAPCSLSNVVFDLIFTDPRGPYHGQKVIEALKNALSSEDTPTELFVLQADVNGAKSRILSSDAEYQTTTNLEKDDLEVFNIYQRIAYVHATMRYMNLPQVAQVFLDVHHRIQDVMSELDRQVGTNSGLRPAQVSTALFNIAPSWLAHYNNWINHFFTFKEGKLTPWVTYAAAALSDAVSRAPPNVLTAAEKLAAYREIAAMKITPQDLLSETGYMWSSAYSEIY